MKKTVVVTVLSLAFSVQVFAADGSQQPAGPGPNFEKIKAEQLNRLEKRIAHLQEEKACIQAATNSEGVKACREKFKSEMKEDRRMMKR